MNSISLVGRLGKDAEVSFREDGTPVTKFRMAVKSGKKDQNTGDWIPDWFGVTAYGEGTHKIAQYLTQGRLVGVTGRLDTWETQDKDKNGYAIVAFRVVTSRVDLLDSGRSEPQAATAVAAGAEG